MRGCRTGIRCGFERDLKRCCAGCCHFVLTGESAREEGFREGGSLTPFFPVQLFTVAKTMAGFYEEWCAHGPLVTRRTAFPGGAVPAEAFAISAAGAIKPQSTQRAQRTEN